MFCVLWYLYLQVFPPPFKLSLLKTNTGTSLALSFGTTILSVSTSSTRDLISNLIWKYTLLLSCLSLTTFWLRLSFGIHPVQPWRFSTPGQRSVVDERVSTTEWKAATYLPSSFLSFPTLYSTSTWGRKLQWQFLFLVGRMASSFCNSPDWAHSWEIYMYMEMSSLMRVWRAKISQANRH